LGKLGIKWRNLGGDRWQPRGVWSRLVGRWWHAEATPEPNARRRLNFAWRGLSGSIATLAIFALACAYGSPEPSSQNFESADPNKPRHFLVLPLNLTIETYPEFSPVLDDVFGAIAGYLRDRGDTLETFSRKEATAGWAASIIKVEESDALEDNFQSAMRVYVEQLAEAHSFDAVISPSIVYRTTKTRDRRAKWDGVFRRIKVVNLSDQAKEKGLARNIEAEVGGISLHVMVFNPDGDLIFERYGGLDLAHDVDMTNAEFTMSPRLSLKQDLLRDSDHLSEGLGVAFDPYLPKR
jgi:hypothetical protein